MKRENMATEKLGFTNREDRDAKVRALKTEGRKHVNKYSTHDGNNPQILYVVTWEELLSTTVQEKT